MLLMIIRSTSFLIETTLHELGVVSNSTKMHFVLRRRITYSAVIRCGDLFVRLIIDVVLTVGRWCASVCPNSDIPFLRRVEHEPLRRHAKKPKKIGMLHSNFCAVKEICVL